MKQTSLDELLKLPPPAPDPEAPIHNFRECLAQSEAGSLEPFWEEVYKEAFPNFVGSMSLRGDTLSQRQGKDRLIHLSSGQTLFVDEKIRPTWRNDNDILLEYEHVGQYNAPGWIEQEKDINYLAYAFILLRRVYLFPWHQLQLAWQQNKHIWQAEYAPVSAANNGYVTYSTPVPTRILRGAVASAAKIQV